MHQHQRSVNKKQQNTKKAERSCGYPGDVLNIHAPAKMLREHQQDRNRAQEIQIGGGAYKGCALRFYECSLRQFSESANGFEGTRGLTAFTHF